MARRQKPLTPKPGNLTVSVSVSGPTKLFERARERAQVDGCSFASWVCRAVEERLERLEAVPETQKLNQPGPVERKPFDEQHPPIAPVSLRKPSEEQVTKKRRKGA